MGPQIRKLFRVDIFDNLLQGHEEKAWDAFRLMSTNFLVNIRAENYKELIEDMSSLYLKIGCNMYLKIHMLHSHFDSFLVNCGMFCDEHREIFIRKLQKWRNCIRESGPLSCWLNAPEQLHKRQAKLSRK